jgi:16S rRNA (adenine1518-N6/adenine1519-N6)-dimethyltransferase
VVVQFFTVPRIDFFVPAGAFTPKPDVDSAVVTLEVRDRPAVVVADESFFMRVIKASFSQRRKTLRNALRQLDIPAAKLALLREKTGIDLGRRAETLTVEEFGKLSNALLK